MSELPRGVVGFKRRGRLVLEVDREVARHKGRVWKHLNDFERRKFENYLVISHAMENTKVIYV